MLKMLKKNEKGLTLVELLAVIVILAVVAMIAIPAIGNIIEKSKVDAAKADVVQIINAAGLYQASTKDGIGVAGITAGELVTKGFLESKGKDLPETAIVKTNASGELVITASAITPKHNIVFTTATKSTIDEAIVNSASVTGENTVSITKKP